MKSLTNVIKSMIGLFICAVILNAFPVPSFATLATNTMPSDHIHTAMGVLEPAEIVGMVFWDVDRNGKMSAADKAINGIEFVLVPSSVPSRMKQKTNKNGETFFNELHPDDYVLELNTKTLNQKYNYIGDQSMEVQLLEGESAEVLFLLKAPNKI